jgi:hypothetical protein
MNELSERRLVENEVIFRNANQNVQEFIEEEEGPDTTTTLPFYCECSNTECVKRIRLTPRQYKDTHPKDSRFIVIPGHEILEIEKIVKKEPDYNVIEKFGKLPSAEEINIALRTIKI